jgi:hypothetical protein
VISSSTTATPAEPPPRRACRVASTRHEPSHS